MVKKAPALPRKTLTLLVPILNEAPVLPELMAQLGNVARTLPLDCEFLFVDDGSTDESVAILKDLQAKDRRIKVAVLSRNFGKEAALSCGLDLAAGDAVIPLDADLQDPPEVIGEMVKLWLQGFEMVNAQRVDRSRDSAFKRVSARWFYKAINAVSDVEIPQDVGDFRLMDRKVVEALKRLPERRRFMKGLFAWIGFRTATVSYVRMPRHAGKGKFNGWKLWNFALEGITSFSTAPLRMWTYFGLLVSAMAFGYGAYLFVRTVLTGSDVPGYASIFLAILFFGGVQMVGMGLMGEYVGRIFMETKQRPLYVIREIV